MFAPELRRVVEWNGAYSSIDLLSPLPLLLLLPLTWLAFKYRAEIPKSQISYVFVAWAAAFSYGLLIGVAQKLLLAGLFGVAIFLLPLSFGAWTLSLRSSRTEIFQRYNATFLVLGGLAGAYGVFQFLVAPPWDTAWMVNVDATSFGQPVPFGIRVFGPLNGPGVFAQFLAGVLIFCVSLLDVRKVWQVVAFAVMLVSLMLSLVRASWLEVLVGFAVLALAHPSRLRSVSSIAFIGAIAVGALATFFAITPNDQFRETLSERFTTFSQISEDGSTLDRSEAASGTLRASLLNPLGFGVGATGVGSKLVDSDVNIFAVNADFAIDNGYLSRLYELGFFGFALFIGALAIALSSTIRLYKLALSSNKIGLVAIAAVSIAYQIATLVGLASGDGLSGLGGTMYFIAISLPFCRESVPQMSAISPSPQNLPIKGRLTTS